MTSSPTSRSRLRKNNKEFPSLPGVYLFKDDKGCVLYVGKAKSLKNRLASYFNRQVESPKTQSLLRKYASIDYIVTPSELEALLLENKLIKKYKPYYNIQWRDDKAYPYLKLSMNEKWPKLAMVRRKEDDGALYFGPYDSKSAKETLKLLTKLFPLRTCKESPMRMRKQPCLQFHIKRCLGPCVNGVTSKQYKEYCRAVADILSGNLSGAIDVLKREMEQMSSEQKFEQAARLRNRISGLKRVIEKKPSWRPVRREIKGETAVSELRDVLGLSLPPGRIEAFDVSNISGSEIVASMVAFENGEPLKEHYRKFIIRGVSGQNDVASINEAVYRRYTKSLKDKMPKPDLILIDGGITQVNAAQSALARARTEIPLVGLAKKEEIIVFPKGRKPLKLPVESEALKLLERVRDEAHRFAVSFHRKRRAARLVKGF